MAEWNSTGGHDHWAWTFASPSADVKKSTKSASQLKLRHGQMGERERYIYIYTFCTQILIKLELNHRLIKSWIINLPSTEFRDSKVSKAFSFLDFPPHYFGIRVISYFDTQKVGPHGSTVLISSRWVQDTGQLCWFHGLAWKQQCLWLHGRGSLKWPTLMSKLLQFVIPIDLSFVQIIIKASSQVLNHNNVVQQCRKCVDGDIYYSISYTIYCSVLIVKSFQCIRCLRSCWYTTWLIWHLFNSIWNPFWPGQHCSQDFRSGCHGMAILVRKRQIECSHRVSVLTEMSNSSVLGLVLLICWMILMLEINMKTYLLITHTYIYIHTIFIIEYNNIYMLAGIGYNIHC